MCIIIVKNSGIDLPDKEILKRCWNKNPHGAGFMFNNNNKIIIKKGFMSYENFYENLLRNDKQYRLKNQSVVFHFRISTSGLIDKGNCHPYPLTNDSIYLRKTNLRCSIGIAHNGIIQEYNHKDSVLNDTQLFIKNIIYDLISNTKIGYYKSEVFKKIMESMIDDSRLAIMNGNGEVVKIGRWYEENGLFFSNIGYKNNSEVRTSIQKKIKLFDNELKYFDNDENGFFIDDVATDECDYEVFLDSLRQLDTWESVYDKFYFQEYSGACGSYFLDEEDNKIYELVDKNHLYYLGNYKTKNEFYITD